VLASHLYGVRPFDMSVMLSGSVIVTVAAILATYLSARRALSISPVDALR